MPAPGTNTASIPPAAAEDSVRAGCPSTTPSLIIPAQVP